MSKHAQTRPKKKTEIKTAPIGLGPCQNCGWAPTNQAAQLFICPECKLTGYDVCCNRDGYGRICANCEMMHADLDDQ